MKNILTVLFLISAVYSFSQTSSDSMNIEKLILKVIDYSDEGKYDKALRVCNLIQEINSNYDRVYFERGMIYLNQEKDELALLDFEKLLTISPEYPGGKDWYSKTLSDLGKKTKAATIKLKELRSNPEGKYGMGVSPNDWAECAQNFIDADNNEIAKSVLNEYFLQYQQKVSNYKSFETAPIRVYTKLLLSINEKKLALSESIKAIESIHAVPADYEIHIEALIENNQIQKAKIKIEKYISEIHKGHESSKTIELKKRINN